jgi:hypothetical protein
VFVVETVTSRQTARLCITDLSQTNKVFIYQFQKKPRFSATLKMTQVPGSKSVCDRGYDIRIEHFNKQDTVSDLRLPPRSS